MHRDEQPVSGAGHRAARAGNLQPRGVTGRIALEPRPFVADTSEMERLGARVSVRRIFAVATGLGIFSSLQAYNYIRLFEPDRDRPFYFLLALNVTYWYAWAALVPGMLWMARRFRFGRHTWKRALAAHCVGVVVFTFTHAVLAIGSRWAIIAALGGGQALIGRAFSVQKSFEELFFLNFDWEMMTYW